jgi:dipeptidyl-peptidase-4
MSIKVTTYRALRGASALCVFILSGLGVDALSSAQTPAPAWRKHSIDRLYSLPWIIGSAPLSPVWSPDSRRLAFLWNDAGTNFQDIWLTDVGSARSVRVTRMPQPDMPAHPGKDVAQLAAVEAAEKDHGVSSVQWLADGKSLVFNFHGRLYQVVPGAAPRVVSEHADGQPAAIASPHGTQVAYVSAGALWVLDLQGEQPAARKLYAPGAQEVGVEAAYWSSDGSRLAFIETDTRNVRERNIPDYLAEETRVVAVKRAFPGEPSESRRIGIVSARGGDVQWASLPGSPLDSIFSVAWSPDGATLLIDSGDLYIKERRLLLVDPATGHARLLAGEQDPHNVTAEWWADWAPDGKGVYFISDRDNDYHLYFQPLAGGAPRRVTSGDWAVFSASVSAPARALFFVANPDKPEERHTLRVPLAGGEPVRLSTRPGYHEPLVSPDGRFVADLYSSDVTPPDLYLSDARRPGSDMRQVTHSPLPEFSQYRWVAAKYVQFPNVNDGTLLHARLTLPPDFQAGRKYPAILGSVYSNTVHNRWGGRIYHPTWGLDQYLAQQGYVIMNVDISGSSGHGKLFRQRIREDYGGVDVEDLYSAVRYLVGEGFVDARRVGIWGSSYGGLLTTMSLFKKPGVYRAGVAGAPATSLYHAETGEMRTMMAPQDHPAQYADSSAFLKSGALQDHLMIIHGMRDDTVLFKDSITLTQRLILQGNDVDLVVLPGSPHGWDTEGLAQTRFAYHKLVDYFDRYLGGGAQP